MADQFLDQKRQLYKEYTVRYSEEKLIEENHSTVIEMMKDIKKDVLWTLPEAHFFKLPIVRKSMIRVLLVYAIMHPSNSYIQGMNDIVAPIFSVYAAGLFEMSYL